MDPSPHLVGDINLKDKIILITGAGSGIGLTFAQLAHKQGASIIIADLKLTSSAEAFLSSSADSIIFKQTDVTNWSHLNALFPFSVDRFGDVPDIVVPAAGVFEPSFSNFWDDTEDSRYATVDINISHVIKLNRLAMRAFASRDKKGVILNVASTAGLAGFYATPMYCATKFAVVGFTRSLGPAERLEGVKVVAICPAGVDTPLWDSRRKLFGFDKEVNEGLLATERVAELMVELITAGKHGGGTVMEIRAQGGAKEVPGWGAASSDGVEAQGMMTLMSSGGAEVHPLFGPAHDAIEGDRKQQWP